MSITQSLNNALSGLNASSRMAEVTSSNLANALTDGYGRRILEVSAKSIGGQGAGVMIDGVVRLEDRAIIGDRRLADSALASQERQSRPLSQIEATIGLPDDPFGLAGRLDAFETALINAGGDPASEQRLTLALSRLGDVTDILQDGARNIQLMRQDADAAIERDIETLNESLLMVEQLNTDIGQSRTQGRDPSALQDQRQRVIDTIGQIVPVRELQRENGRVALMTPGGEMMLDGPATTYDFVAVGTITADMTFASTALSGITRNGASLSPIDGIGKLSGGSLGASFILRDATLVDAQRGLDEIAADLITRFESATTDPSIAPGDPGLLTDGGTVHDPLDIVGLARRIEINAAVDPVQGGEISRWRDGVGAAAAGPVGNAAQLNRWVDALSNRQSIDPSIPSLSANGQIARVASLFGTDRIRGDEAKAFATSRRDTLYQAELANGVDSDYELQNLLRIEQAYAANAKVIQTASAMIDRLMEI